jgi:hypothetical protein
MSFGAARLGLATTSTHARSVFGAAREAILYVLQEYSRCAIRLLAVGLGLLVAALVSFSLATVALVRALGLCTLGLCTLGLCCLGAIVLLLGGSGKGKGAEGGSELHDVGTLLRKMIVMVSLRSFIQRSDAVPRERLLLTRFQFQKHGQK